MRSWLRGFEAGDGFDLRKPLTKQQRQRIHRAYNKLRQITPGATSQQNWLVKEVRSERTSKLYQDYAKLPVKLKGLKRVPLVTTDWQQVAGGPAAPKFHIDYRARGGKGEVRQTIGRTRVKTIEFDKVKLLAGDAEYIGNLANEMHNKGNLIGTLIMGGREAVQLPWFTDAKSFLDVLGEIMERYSPLDEDIDAILAGDLKPKDAWDYLDESDNRGTPWTVWLDGARIYYRPDGSDARDELPQEFTDKNKRKTRKPLSKRQRIKGR